MRGGVLRYLRRRLGTSVVTLLGVVVVTFLLVRVLPGDGAQVRAGPYASPEQVEALRREYGLDQPVPAQFGDYLSGVVTGDLGTSLQTGRPVTGELLQRLPATLELALLATVVAAVLGIGLGVVAAARRDTVGDHVVRTIGFVGSSTALFWLGLLLIFFGFYRLGWFPGPAGRLPTGVTPPGHITGLYVVDALLRGDVALAWTSLHSLILPVLTLGLVTAAPILKMTRAAMIDVLDADHVRTARSFDVPPVRLLLTDGLRNAMLPIVTTIGIVFGYLLGGNVIVESLYSWPGIGRYAYASLQAKDLDALQGFVILVGAMYITANVLVDVAYAVIDPHISLGAGEGRS